MLIALMLSAATQKTDDIEFAVESLSYSRVNSRSRIRASRAGRRRSIAASPTRSTRPPALACVVLVVRNSESLGKHRAQIGASLLVGYGPDDVGGHQASIFPTSLTTVTPTGESVENRYD